MFRRRPKGPPAHIEEFFRDPLRASREKWAEYMEWLPGAMTYSMDCLSTPDAYKEEMVPVLFGMAEMLRGSEAIFRLYEPEEGARELMAGVRDFREGFINDDVDRMNAGWSVMVALVGRTHPEIFERGSDSRA